MTLPSSLGKVFADMMNGHLENGAHPTPSPESTPPTTTPSTRTEMGASEVVAMLDVVMTKMAQMMEQSQRETRELVVTILQGRVPTPEEREALTQPLTSSFDPPDYDDPSMEGLPGGIQAVFEREQAEMDELRRLQTEHDILERQREHARAALNEQDPQGDSANSWLKDSPVEPL